GKSQDDAGTSDLIPGQRITVSDLLQDSSIVTRKVQGRRFSATHEKTSRAVNGFSDQHSNCPEFLASFVARATSKETGEAGAGEWPACSETASAGSKGTSDTRRP